MKYNIELLKSDIRDELDKIGYLEKELLEAQKRISKTLPDPISYYDRGAIGYLLHNFYSGCENIFKSIARFFENDLASDSWHRDLLKRMKVEVKGYRPAVIDNELFYMLDDFRAFRHKFRHSYSFELDWEKESLLVNKFENTAGLFKRQIQAFLDILDGIDQ